MCDVPMSMGGQATCFETRVEGRSGLGVSSCSIVNLVVVVVVAVVLVRTTTIIIIIIIIIIIRIRITTRTMIISNNKKEFVKKDGKGGKGGRRIYLIISLTSMFNDNHFPNSSEVKKDG